MNRAQAFKYALHENGHHPEVIVELSHEIELDISPFRRSRTRGAGHVGRSAMEKGDYMRFVARS